MPRCPGRLAPPLTSTRSVSSLAASPRHLCCSRRGETSPPHRRRAQHFADAVRAYIMGIHAKSSVHLRQDLISAVYKAYEDARHP